MKRSGFSEGQIIKILKETEITGKIVADVYREQGIAQSTYLHNPGEIDHIFRGKPSTDSGGCRPLIPEQTVHFLIGSGIE